MGWVSRTGHSWVGGPVLDNVGIAYIVLTVLYTLVLTSMITTVYVYRHVPAVKMRNIPLSISAILLLQTYLIVIMSVYPMNSVFPCGLEYWIMSLWFPLGIASFQLLNSQLLVKSIEQNSVLYDKTIHKPVGKGPTNTVQRLRYNWDRATHQQRYTACILAGMMVQVIVSLAIYLSGLKSHHFDSASPKYNPSSCRSGWEWIPTIAWQFIWAWLFGPYLLWRIRMIRDIYGWRRQTMIAVIASLPGSPLWLAGIYAPGFSAINKYWPPAMWFAPGIITMQLVTLSGPLSLIVKHMKFERETQAFWNERSGHSNLVSGDSSKGFSSEVTATQISTADSATNASVATGWTQRKKAEANSMAALERTLDTDPDQLQRFAALREFAGENIRFLVSVRKWKTAYHRTLNRFGEMPPSSRRGYWNEATEIYISFIDPRFSEFTVNVESAIYKNLKGIFADAVVALERRPSSTLHETAPWEGDDLERLTPGITPNGSKNPMDNLHPQDDYLSAGQDTKAGSVSSLHNKSSFGAVSNESSEQIIPSPSLGLDFKPRDDGSNVSGGDALIEPTAALVVDAPVPQHFDATVFDAAESSVRYMVLNNSWRNFQKAIERGEIRTSVEYN